MPGSAGSRNNSAGSGKCQYKGSGLVTSLASIKGIDLCQMSLIIKQSPGYRPDILVSLYGSPKAGALA